MEVPKKIVVDFGKESGSNAKQQLPAGYYTESEDDFDDDDSLDRVQVDPAVRLMSPPKKLTVPDISDEEKRRYMRDTSMSGPNASFLAEDDSLYKTPNDTVYKNVNSFQSGDPVSIARQVRHLHNRVKLLEEEIRTQQNRQIFLIGFLSVYILTKGVKWMFR